MNNYKYTRRRIIKKSLIGTLLIAIIIIASSMIKEFTSNDNKNNQKKEETTIDVSQVKDICKLATLECKFENVAKINKDKGEGFFHYGEKERQKWIKYQVNVVVSYDISQIEMEQKDNDVYIYLPEPEVESSVVQSSLSEDSCIENEDRWLQENPITAEEETAEIANSCEEIKNEVRNNSSLLSTAEQQAKTLIENYIDQMGKINNTQYNVHWSTQEMIEEARAN